MTNKHRPKSTRTRLNAKDRKQQLLKIAIRTMAEKGLGHARHTDIAEIADVAVSTVFFYFPSVETLDAEIIEEVSKFISKCSFNAYLKETTEVSLLINIEQYINHFYETISVEPEYLKILINWSGAVGHPTWNIYLKFRQNQIDALEKTLLAAKESGEISAELNVNATAKLLLANFMMITRISYFDDSQGAIKLAVEGLKLLLKP